MNDLEPVELIIDTMNIEVFFCMFPIIPCLMELMDTRFLPSNTDKTEDKGITVCIMIIVLEMDDLIPLYI